MGVGARHLSLARSAKPHALILLYVVMRFIPIRRRELDVERDLARFECTIVTTGASMESVDFTTAEAAVRVLERIGFFTSFNISGV